MRRLILGMAIAAWAASTLAGCGKITGPRFWWDDRNQERLPDGYQLPVNPGDPSMSPDSESERPALPSGEDLTDDNLRDYRTDLDLQEEKRKSEAALFDF